MTQRFEQRAAKLVDHEGSVVGYQISADDWRAIRAALRRAGRIRPCARCGQRSVYYEHAGDMTCCEGCVIAIATEVEMEAAE